jgi:hypothetical protein
MKRFALVLLVLGVFLVPALSQAQTSTLPTSCPVLTRNLVLGSRGEDVQWLQIYLLKQGFGEEIYYSRGWGYYGPYTSIMVARFQKSIGLPVTGTVGPLTRAAIAVTSCPNQNISVSGMSASSVLVNNGSAEPTGASLRFTFTLSNNGSSDIYVSKNPNIALGVRSTAYKGGLTVVTASPSVISADTSVAFGIPAGSMRQFTYEGYLDNKDGIRGYKIFSIEKINYSTNISNLTEKAVIGGIDALTVNQLLGGNGTNPPYINIEAPNGGETWDMGTEQQISYKTSVDGTVYFYLQFADGFMCNMGSGPSYSGWFDLIPSSTGCGNDTSKRITAGQYRVALFVSAPGETSDTGTAHDYSDGYITFSSTVTQPRIKVLSPNGGEIWQKWGINTVTFTPIVGQQNEIDLVDSSTQSEWILATVNGQATDKQSVNVSIPFSVPPGSTYKIRVDAVGANCPQGFTCLPLEQDQSDNYFTIGSSATTTLPSITVLSPNGGETYGVGTKVQIKWTGTNLGQAPIEIRLSSKDLEFHSYINQYILASAGSYDWTIPSNLVPAGTTGAFRINIICAKGAETASACNDFSDAYFNVVGTSIASAPSCTITSDKSSYKLGEVITFSWTSQNATYGWWMQDTSGKDHLILPGDKLSANGSQQVVANVLGNPFATLNVAGDNNGTASCTRTVSVTSAAAPTMTRIYPASATPGTKVLITGTGFQSANMVMVGSTVLYDITSPLGTYLNFTTPSLPNGTYPVRVINNNGSSNSMDFTVSNSAVSPSVSVSNGTAIATLINNGSLASTKASVAFTFTLKNTSNTDYYIPVVKPFGYTSSATFTGLTNSSVSQAGDTATALILPAASQRTFKYEGILDNSNGVTGQQYVKIIQITYGQDSSGSTNAVVTSGLESLGVTVSLNGGSVAKAPAPTTQTGNFFQSILNLINQLKTP